MYRTCSRPIPESPRRAMTLVELVISSALTVILLGGMASAIVLATRAMPENRAELDGLVDGAAVLEQLATELALAEAVTEATGTSLTYAIPDQDADGTPETIRYSWSGVSGDPLLRALNGKTAIEVLASVDLLGFAYEGYRPHDDTGEPVEGEEQELIAFTNEDSLSDDKPEGNKMFGQAFVPSLPDEAKAWRITAVDLRLRQDGAINGVLGVRLCQVIAGVPTLNTLADRAVPEATLSSKFAWYTVSFPDCPELSPDDGVGVLLYNVTGHGVPARFEYQGGSVTTGARFSAMVRYDKTWDIETDKSLLYRVRGTVFVPDDSAPMTLTRVGVSLRLNDEENQLLSTSVALLNMPEATP